MLGEEGGRIRTVPPQVAEGGAETCVFIHPCQLYWSVRAVRMFRAPGPCFQAIPRHPRGQFLLFFFFFHARTGSGCAIRMSGDVDADLGRDDGRWTHRSQCSGPGPGCGGASVERDMSVPCSEWEVREQMTPGSGEASGGLGGTYAFDRGQSGRHCDGRM